MSNPPEHLSTPGHISLYLDFSPFTWTFASPNPDSCHPPGYLIFPLKLDIGLFHNNFPVFHDTPASKPRYNNIMATKSCDQAAPNFSSAQNNLEISKQSMSPSWSMFTHYQTHMQSMSTIQQTYMQSRLTIQQTFMQSMATMIAKTARLSNTTPLPKGGTTPPTPGGDRAYPHSTSS